MVVTGGSSGIGNALARAFRDHGAAVTATGTGARESYASDLEGMDYRALELGDDEAIAAFAEEIERLDVLVNCAGMVAYRGQEFEVDTFRRVMDVNLTAILQLATLLRPKLAQRSGPNIAPLMSPGS